MCASGRKTKATTIFEDNQGAIALTDSPNDHPKTKHISVKYHAIRDFIEYGDITIRYLETSNMVADCLTKALEKVAFTRLIDSAGMIDT